MKSPWSIVTIGIVFLITGYAAYTVKFRPEVAQSWGFCPAQGQGRTCNCGAEGACRNEECKGACPHCSGPKT